MIPYIPLYLIINMVVVDQQLKEEIYDLAKRRLVLESELKKTNFFLATLKKEFDLRIPQPQ